jgi:hypothetical protein
MGLKLQLSLSGQGTSRENVGNNRIETGSELKKKTQIARSD